MRAVVATEEGTVEVAYMWLPTFMGMNSALKKEIEDALKNKVEGKFLTEETLDEASDMVIDFLEKKFSEIKGLREHLDGLKYVSF